MTRRFRLGMALCLVLMLLASACGGIPAAFTPAQPVENPGPVLPATTPTLAPPITFSRTWTPTTVPPTVTASPSPSITPTPDPYADLTIDYLANRDYGGGELQILETLQQTSLYTRYLVTYPSEGLTIYGFMDVPAGEGNFPVVIAIHGYIDPAVYQTLDYTTGNADAIARAGYLVIHPNLRGYPPSDDGPNLFRVGMAIDVLNLIAIVKEQAGTPGALQKADAQFLGLWGHSMGGGIATRVITVSGDVDAAVLYGAMSGDEKRNFEAIYGWSDGERGIEELNVPDQALARISPVYYLDRIRAAVSIHHGGSDELVPFGWSQEMCERLQALGASVECFTYRGQPHTLYGAAEELLNRRVVEFFDRYLKGSR
ncbi:MAG TPA: alpha/beta fold hydrolase [Anaerolineales bacterium]|nr:alpha/beta fold hydrolase [Anaerolineales bacterium]